MKTTSVILHYNRDMASIRALLALIFIVGLFFATDASPKAAVLNFYITCMLVIYACTRKIIKLLAIKFDNNTFIKSIDEVFTKIENIHNTNDIVYHKKHYKDIRNKKSEHCSINIKNNITNNKINNVHSSYTVQHNDHKTVYEQIENAPQESISTIKDQTINIIPSINEHTKVKRDNKILLASRFDGYKDDDLVSQDKAATLLGVQQNTLAQWRSKNRQDRPLGNDKLGYITYYIRELKQYLEI